MRREQSVMEDRIHRLEDRDAYCREKLVSLAASVGRVVNTVNGLEANLRSAVSVTLKEFMASQSRELDVWTQKAEQWKDKVQHQVKHTCLTMDQHLKTLQTNTEISVACMKTLLEKELSVVREQASNVEMTTIAQITTLDRRFEQLSGAVDEAMAVLHDVKSRQASLAKSNARQAQQGPLHNALSFGDTPPVLFKSSVKEKFRTLSICSVRSATERGQVAGDERISEMINEAQVVATVARGRSIGNRISAAQSVARSRSASRSSSRH